MMTLSFHWAWLLIAVVLIATAIIAHPHFKKGGDSIGQAFDCFIGYVIVAIGLLVAAVLGGIFIW